MVLARNPDLQTLRKFSQILAGERIDATYNPSVVTKMKFAPLTSCDVERVFSCMNATIRPNRRRLSEEKIQHVLILQWNGKINL